MPLDIWLEIFRLLAPIDLLHLARSTKPFRETLMSRSTALQIWRHSREQCHPDLPSPDDIISEPAWINLFFYNRCHFCVKTVRRSIDSFDLGIRICPKCVPSALLPVGMVPPEDKMFVPLIPSFFWVLNKVQQTVVYRPHLDAVKHHFQALNTEVEQKLYIEKRHEYCSQWQDLAEQGSDWYEEMKWERQKTRQDVRECRKLLINTRLIQMGFKDELDDRSCATALEKHPFIRQSHPLTDEAWEKNCPTMETFMTSLRLQRLARVRNAVVTERRKLAVDFMHKVKTVDMPVREGGTDLVMKTDPAAPDWFQFPVIHEILERPNDHRVEDVTFSAALPQVLHDMIKWSTGLHESLFRVLAKDGIPVQSNSHLALACCVVTCRTCSLPLFYPDVLYHPCNTIGVASEEDYKADYKESEAHRNYNDLSNWFAYTTRCVRRPWTAEDLCVDLHLTKIVHEVIGLVGLDPQTTRVKDLDALSVYFHYLDCVPLDPPNMIVKPGTWPGKLNDYYRELSRTIPKEKFRWPMNYYFGWRKFVLHLYQTKFSGTLVKGGNVVLVDEKLHVEQLKKKAKGSFSDPDGWLCTSCCGTSMEMMPANQFLVKMHIEYCHRKEDEKQRERVDYFRHPNIASEISRSSLAVLK
ncbi:hypothetical protein BDZ89DRAFT_989135 [Hymenopellis radicata]|nr:hypothetical protein BDZ89DRAFT_989135 [Hymenopellis radicata]